jgi:gliding motility-associated-like protein
MKLLLSILLLVGVNTTAFYAQAGNDDCTSSTTLCANQAQPGSTQDATISVCVGCSDGATAAGNFCFSLENTVWFSFTTNSIGGDAQIDFSNMAFDLTTGFGSSLEAVIIEAGVPCDESTYNAVSNCETTIDGTVGQSTLTALGLQANTTYYVQIDGSMTGVDTEPASATFDLTVSGTAVDQIPPTVGIVSSATDVCVNDDVTFTANASGCNSTSTVEWFVNGSTVSAGTVNTFTSTGFSDGDEITATFTCTGDCPISSTSGGIVLAVDDPMADAGMDILIPFGESTILQGSGDGSYLWGPIDDLSSPASPQPLASPGATTTYQLTVTSAGGCESYDEVTVFLDSPIYSANTLTPNEDGINDYWEIRNISKYPRAKVNVYDRWGQKVFNVIGYTNDKRWDGTYKGLKLPAATYFYVIDLQTGNDKGIVTGSITIIL